MEGYKIVATPLDNNKALKKEDGSPKANYKIPNFFNGKRDFLYPLMKGKRVIEPY